MRYLPFMQAVRHNLVASAETLSDLGYKFVSYYSDPSPVQAPTDERWAVIQMLQDAGWPMPQSLQAFFEVVGCVEFTGVAPASWTGCQYPDPISIIPADLTFWCNELEEWNLHRTEHPDDLWHSTFYVQAAGDHVHKAGYSGGVYSHVFTNADDGLFDGEQISLPFTQYLGLCDTWGGFPGLRSAPDHSWPLEKLRQGFVELPLD